MALTRKEDWEFCLNDYMVSSMGNVKRRWDDFPMEKSPNDEGYLKCSLTTNKKSKTWFVHRLVAEAFLGPQPGPEYSVDHRNREKHDNRVSNLRWATKSEQSANRKKKVSCRVRSQEGRSISEFDGVNEAALQLKESNDSETSPHKLLVQRIRTAIRLKRMYKGRKWEFVASEPTGRIARIPDFPMYQASDCGMIQQKSGRWTFGNLPSKFYKVWVLKNKLVHRLIAETFCPGRTEKLNTVCHLNGIFTDNRSVNLRWMTRQDTEEHHIQLGVRRPRFESGHPIRQMCARTGATIAVYAIPQDAARAVDGSSACIQACACGALNKSAGYKWQWADSSEVTVW